ncbi:MAG TPA: 30S ribosomal protein S11 [Patescibacteria group bacterium]|nr:30S ribosomal protein S11 [Patescibacteria group bacterium]
MAVVTPKKAAPKRQVQKGRVYVQATFNNTIVTITDDNGHTICWGSSGHAGFSGSRKSTPYAATVTVEKAVDKSKDFGLRTVDVFIKGPGPGRDAVLRVIRSKGLRVGMIADVTPIPHNGTRPRKQRHG